MQRIAGIRKNLASQLGYYLPPVKVNDNVALRAREYTLLIKGVEMARYELPAGQELAIPSAGVDGSVRRHAHQGSGLQSRGAVDSRPNALRFARSHGYTVVDDVSVMGTHLAEVVRRHAHELFTRQDTKNFCDRVAQTNPKVVEDLVPKMLSLSVIQTSASESFAGAGPDSRLRDDPGGSERRSANDQESGAAHRIRAPGDSPGHRQLRT